MMDNPDIRDLADIPAIEVISRAAVMLMSSAAEKLGLSSADPDTSEYRDLDEARRLITALAGLITATTEYLGPHAKPLKDGLRSLQLAFREASAAPDEPGFGPGESLYRASGVNRATMVPKYPTIRYPTISEYPGGL